MRQTDTKTVWRSMHFAEQLSTLRKARNLSQYETGRIQPNLAVLKRLVVALNVSADTLIFDEQECSPRDEGVKLILQALDDFTPEELANGQECAARACAPAPGPPLGRGILRRLDR